MPHPDVVKKLLPAPQPVVSSTPEELNKVLGRDGMAKE